MTKRDNGVPRTECPARPASTDFSPPVTKAHTHTEQADEPMGGLWIPKVLAREWRISHPLHHAGTQATLYLVTKKTSGEKAVAKVYHPNAKVKADLLKLIKTHQPPHVVRLRDFGKDEGRWWELMDYAPEGSLLELIDDTGPRLQPKWVHIILHQTHQALAALHALEIEHRDLKPANVLVGSRAPLELALIDFGISSEMAESIHATGMGRTAFYSPPEGLGMYVGQATPQVTIHRTRWDYWSLGMMLVEMLTGRHPFAGMEEAAIVLRLTTMNVDALVEGVDDPDWRKLCRGLLRRDPRLRWGSDEVTRWLADPADATLTIAEESAPLAAGFLFVGKAYTSPPDLGEAFYANWQAARRTWENSRHKLLQWIQDDLGQPDKADEIEQAVAAYRTHQVTAKLKQDGETLIVAKCLAPHAVPRINGIALTMTSIAGLVDDALAHANEEERASAVKLKAILDGRFLQIAANSPEGHSLSSFADAYEKACDDYWTQRDTLAKSDVSVPELSTEDHVRLFAAQLPNNTVLQGLRKHAKRAVITFVKDIPFLYSSEYIDYKNFRELPFLKKDNSPQLRSQRQVKAKLSRLIKTSSAGYVIGLASVCESVSLDIDSARKKNAREKQKFRNECLKGTIKFFMVTICSLIKMFTTMITVTVPGVLFFYWIGWIDQSSMDRMINDLQESLRYVIDWFS